MKRILIVEDDETFVYFCKVILERSQNSYEVLTAYDGVEALEVIDRQESTIDLILLDVNMPRMNGHQFLAKYNERNPSSIPIVVMLTSSDQDRDREQSNQYSFVKDYLVKPLTEEHIKRFESLYETAASNESSQARKP
ncbi:MAG: response regulator [Planctomycetota bacterium]